MEIPKNVLKKLAADFREWAFIRNPSDTDFWTGIDDNGGCWDFEIDADPYVRMEDGAPEPDYPVVVDVNVYQENIFHTKMLLKEFDLKHYMFHTKPEDLTDSERQEITAALWKEMREIYYGRNMPAV